MNVRIQSVHFDADQKLVDYVSEKIEKLKTNTQRRVIYIMITMMVEFTQTRRHQCLTHHILQTQYKRE